MTFDDLDLLLVQILTEFRRFCKFGSQQRLNGWK